MKDSEQNRILQNQSAIEIQRDAKAENLEKSILLYIMLFNHAYIFICTQHYKSQLIHLKIILCERKSNCLNIYMM